VQLEAKIDEDGKGRVDPLGKGGDVCLRPLAYECHVLSSKKVSCVL
jgi:hypothetical protein